MRINLKTPFAEKDAAKALGARWDGARKIWYVTDAADLTPFMRWIPDLAAATHVEAGMSVGATPETSPATVAGTSPKPPAAKHAAGVITRPATTVQHCGCRALPWVECEHSD
jgi:hypothetical protein